MSCERFSRNCLRWIVGLAALVASLQAAATSAEEPDPGSLIPRNTVWKYCVGRDSRDEGWNTREFDDKDWKSGTAGFGYGDNDDRTVLNDMLGKHATLRIRRTFEITRPEDIQALLLYVRFDDGFIAYLNGTEVARACVEEANGRVTVRSHEAGNFEPFDLSRSLPLLRAGTNVLAIEGYNVELKSSDFTLDPFLRSTPVTESLALYSAQDYLADIDAFERRLSEQSSYLTRLGFDYQTALAQLRASVDDSTSLPEFTLGLQKILMQIGDCHAGLGWRSSYPIRGTLPLRLADTADGIVALKLHSDELIDADHPYIVSLDHVPFERWLQAAEPLAPHGSPQFRRRQALRWLVLFDRFRDDLGVARNAIVTVKLRSANHDDTIETRLRMSNEPFSVATVKPGQHRMLAGNIGYVRIATMDDRLIDGLAKQIEAFRDTSGLIIDVRDNSGGTYGILRALYPYFRPADAEPYVTNIAAYRLSPHFQPNHLAYRPTFRVDSPHWNDAERTAIKQAVAAFKPEWVPPQDQFSAWHYMVLDRQQAGRSPDAANYFHYDKPVVVLSNAGSFSATDGFLSAFADLPQVTIVGEPSGGGSGATRRYVLPNTKLEVALSSMASFRPNGKTFDGNGVEVDVLALPRLEDFLTDTDSVLERGLEVLRKR